MTEECLRVSKPKQENPSIDISLSDIIQHTIVVKTLPTTRNLGVYPLLAHLTRQHMTS